MARLLYSVADGDASAELSDRTSVGRHPESALRLHDPYVSKEHFVVERRAGRFVLCDRGSQSGTLVDGHRVAGEIELRHGMSIAIGKTVMRFEDDVAPVVRVSLEPASRAHGVAQPTLVGAVTLEIDANASKFQPYDSLDSDERRRRDYERLRLSHSLSREIALERDPERLMLRIIETSMRFVDADRGAIFVADAGGELREAASVRRDGRKAPFVVSSTILSRVVRQRRSVLTNDAASEFATDAQQSVLALGIRAAIVAPLVHEGQVHGVLWLDSGSDHRFEERDLEIVTSVANQAAMFLAVNRLARQVELEIIARERFAKMVSPNVADRIRSGELEVAKGGRRVEPCTVFNSDIRGFTRLGERMSPEEVVELLNEYFERMVEVIFEFGGTLDKFMGDGVLAVWGAPTSAPNDASQSIRCALAQTRVLAAMNEARVRESRTPIEIGIGIHTGPVVAGYVGSSKTLSYTVIGDTANTSARLCGVAGAGEIVVSRATLDFVRGEFEVLPLPPAKVKNKELPIECYRVIGVV